MAANKDSQLPVDTIFKIEPIFGLKLS